MYSAPDEAQLINDCQQQVAAAQQQLYEGYARKMMGVCMRYVNDYETARDLLHDGFIKVFTHISSFQGEGSFEGWLRRVFVTTALEYLRKNDVLRESYDISTNYNLQTEEETIIERISADELRAIIGTLPTGFRTVFNLYAVEGYSHKEIGKLLNITESTSRSQFARAKNILKQKIVAQYG
jgi:RNA polymerase sigma-70 factor (ECF subfamily)